jgi:hypothetical protein
MAARVERAGGSGETVSDLDRTLAAVALHGWQVVLLGTRSKRPNSKPWHITTDVDEIRRHVEHGGNIGLVCGPASGVAVLDGDDLDRMRAMFAALGALAIWVETGSGKWHCYVAWEPNLPAKLMWQGRKVGEIQRGGIGPDGQPVLQQVVMDPSIHPDTRRAYQWRVDPSSPLPTLPGTWRAYLAEPVSRHDAPPLEPAPAWIPHGTRGITVEDDLPWDGPPAAELLRRALLQPGPSRDGKGELRRNGVKFACPACREICPDCGERHDKDGDNAIVRNDGRFGCAVNVDHRRAIAVALGVIVADLTPTIAGYDARTLRRLGAFRL